MASSSLIRPTSPRILPLTCRPHRPSLWHMRRCPPPLRCSPRESPTPAWKLKPSWYVVAKADRTINADLERMYAERAHSHKVEAEGASHAVYISRAKEVAALIEEAANQARVAAK
jgi:pimeloyl-ACP methyl ester carboxylesterase